MTVQMQMDARPFPSRRWFLLALSVFVPLVLLSLALLSAGTAEAEPLAPTSTVSGTVVNPDGSAISGTTTVCLMHFYPGEDWVDWEDCQDTAGSFTFVDGLTMTIPLGDLFVQAEAPWDSGYFASLPAFFHLGDPSDFIALGNVSLTHASFAGMVYEPGGVTLADGGYVSVVDGDWNDVAWGDYYTGAYAVGGVPAGNLMLGPVDYVYFDPEAGEYVSIGSEPFAVTFTLTSV